MGELREERFSARCCRLQIVTRLLPLRNLRWAPKSSDTFIFTPFSVGVNSVEFFFEDYTGKILPKAKQVTITVVSPLRPTIDYFTISKQGRSSKEFLLSWSVTGATALTLNPPAACDMSVFHTTCMVSPTKTTAYTLTATGPGGTTIATVTVTISAESPTGHPHPGRKLVISSPATQLRSRARLVGVIRPASAWGRLGMCT